MECTDGGRARPGGNLRVRRTAGGGVPRTQALGGPADVLPTAQDRDPAPLAGEGPRRLRVHRQGVATDYPRSELAYVPENNGSSSQGEVRSVRELPPDGRSLRRVAANRGSVRRARGHRRGLPDPGLFRTHRREQGEPLRVLPVYALLKEAGVGAAGRVASPRRRADLRGPGPPTRDGPVRRRTRRPVPRVLPAPRI